MHIQDAINDSTRTVTNVMMKAATATLGATGDMTELAIWRATEAPTWDAIRSATWDALQVMLGG